MVPWVSWECYNEVWTDKQAGKLLGTWNGNGEKGKRVDYVVDAIDNIDSKVALLKYCHQHRLKVVSSMGAGCKSDPTRVFVGDISSSNEDPLSRSTRRRLRAEGINDGISVVYSTEKPGPGKAELLPLPEEEFLKGQVEELSILPDFRARILPVLGTMPAVFGYAAANFVILELTGYPHEESTIKGREKLYDSILANLQGSEERLLRSQGLDALRLRIPITRDDVGYLIEEVYRGKSVISGLTTRLTLVRWTVPVAGFTIDEHVPDQKVAKFKLADLVCMTKEEALEHERHVLIEGRPPERVYDEDVITLVKRRREEESYYNRYR